MDRAKKVNLKVLLSDTRLFGIGEVVFGDPDDYVICVKGNFSWRFDKSPPLNLSIENRTSRVFHISWREPFHKNGILSSYKVEVVAVESFLKSHVGWNSSETVSLDSYTVTRLHPASQYNISVRASTSVGYGPATTILAYTLDDVPGPPLKLKMNNRTSTALQMSWNEPLEKNGILVNYKVEEVAVESFLESHVGWNSSETVLLDSFTVTGLHPASQYNISVRASTSVGYGPATTILAFTLDDVPGPPLELKMNNRTSTALQMSWNEPLEKNGILVNYKVEVVAVESFLESHMGWNSSETVLLDSYTVTGLHPASQYNISVRASTSVGYGPATTILAYTINDGQYVTFHFHKQDTNRLQTSVYYKPSFEPNYIHFTSYCPLSHKINTIKTLTKRIHTHCSQQNSKMIETQNIINNLQQAGYPITLY
ncbi:hypothetical protein LAZ67_11000792 [Cordylochernes scorpioides]|uniref:Fibronectin type-III domain-containing protein n=1 Tax=Cordylochernes scorpioides TaxID=51811 RepID=A0ABY6KYH2_9ARAC|nr:hypothetical protein LAZ67_11000792 [Cordylochernes scorpioides]